MGRSAQPAGHAFSVPAQMHMTWAGFSGYISQSHIPKSGSALASA